MADTASKHHPVHYTVFQPNVLVRAESDMKLMERRLYTEILSFNHREEADELTYFIPYELITESKERQANKNFRRDFIRIAESMQSKILHLDQEFMKLHFGKDIRASLVPFPYIEYEDMGFKITLERHFKIILTRLDLGFTKGDIELLRGLQHTYSHHMYWLIRYNQWRESSLSLEIEKLKEALGCAGKYKAIKDFKKWVLEPIRKEFSGTWVEFDYELIRKGRGGAAKAITLHFKSDVELEKGLSLGKVYNFERALEQYGITQQEIKKIRQYVTLGEEVREGYHWNELYIHAVVQLVKEQYKKKKQNPHASQIRNMGAYILAVLKSGFFIEQVKIIEKDMRLRGQQLNVFETQPPVQEPIDPEPQEKFKGIPYEDFKELYEAHKQLHDDNLTESAYAQSLGYKIEGEFLIRIQQS